MCKPIDASVVLCVTADSLDSLFCSCWVYLEIWSLDFFSVVTLTHPKHQSVVAFSETIIRSHCLLVKILLLREIKKSIDMMSCYS